MSKKRVVTLSKLYTRSGDDGLTGLVGGSRCSKDDLRVISYGEVDELNACMGLCAQQASDDLRGLIEVVQQRLFDLGAHLADGRPEPQLAIDQADIDQLEAWVDSALEGLPDLTSFVLPGGGELSARMHLARTVCRRAERAVITSQTVAERSPLALIYLNRLSDLLFAWSRLAAHQEGHAELLWVPKQKS